MIAKARHWFWHIYAMLRYTNLFDSNCTDAEWERYRAFMLSRGYRDGNLVP